MASAFSKFAVCFLLAVGFGAALCCLAKLTTAEQLPLKNYTISEGLAHGRVENIERDSHGFLWFCTYDGLSRFDGNNFVNYGTRDGLAHSRLNDLIESRDGTYWVATNQGLSSFIPSEESRIAQPVTANAEAARPFFTNYSIGDDKGSNSIITLLEDRSGRLWVGTQGGLYLKTGRDPSHPFQRVSVGHPAKPDNLFEVATLLEDDEGSLWIGSFYGLARRLPDGRFIHYSVFPGEGLDSIRAMGKDEKGRLWIGHQAGLMIYQPEPAAQAGAGLVHLESKAQTHNLRDGRWLLPAAAGEARWYTTEDGMVDQRVRAICQSADGHIWLGTVTGGLVEFDNGQIHLHGMDQGVSRLITSLAEDNTGNLWVGSQVGGATRISRRGFSTYRESDGLGMADVFSIFEDRAGELIVVNNGWFLNRLNEHPGDRKFISVIPNLPEKVKGAGTGNRPMIQAHDGEWWIATGEGLFRFPAVARLEDLATARPKAVYLEKDGMASSNISRLFEDSRGDVWASSYTPPVTLTRWERATGKLNRYGIADGIPENNWPHVFAEDRAGDVWLGLHYGELMRFRQGRFEVFGKSDNVPEGMMLALFCDHSGRLWIATEGGGAARVDNPAADRPQFVRYTVAQGLSSDSLHSFTEDRWGRIYIGTSRGVDRLEVNTGQIRRFTTGDGLTKGEVIAAFADHHGWLWFGTRQGLSRLQPEEKDTKLESPPALISGVMIGGQRQPIPELGQREIRGLTLNPDQSQIQIEFFGLSFLASAPLLYQYKIEGVDHDWSAPSEQRTVTASLAPGTYRFLVRAVGMDGKPGEKPAIVAFRVLPPFYQRWWFIALAAASVAAAGYYAYRLRVKRLVEIERVRTRIATDLHDDIGASLSRVAILSEVVKQQGMQPATREQVGQNGHNGHSAQSAQMLTEIADSARGLVDSMSDIVWSIDPRRDDLSHVIARARQFAADVLDAQGIAWQFTAPPEIEKTKLDPEQRRHLFLILKESLNNIARHSGCQTVAIKLSASGHQLRAEISDDGLGFTPQPAGLPAAVLPKSRGGNGLGNMQARAAELGGDLRIDSAPGRGTRLSLTIPLKK